MFVKKDAEGRYVQPDYTDPGLDKWAKAVEEDEGQDADSSGWQRDKVMKHVRETAVAEKFTNAQKEEWEALFDFHARFTTPESLPMAPHVLETATTGQRIELHGMPISWAEMWATLRRLPRQHLNTARAPPSLAPAAASSSSPAEIQKGLALENSVTGTNHPKRLRDKDAEVYKTQVEVSSLPRHLADVEVKHLYFVALPSFEGEMAVGLGRVSARITSGSTRAADVEWLVRRGWSDVEDQPGFLWGKSPMFDPYKVQGRVAKNEHPLTDFLPVEVELTDGSTHIQAKSLTHAKQRFCITHRCVVRLREYCRVVRTELIRLEHGATGGQRKRAKA